MAPVPVCRQCGGPLPSTHANRATCSNSCRMILYRARRTAALAEAASNLEALAEELDPVHDRRAWTFLRAARIAVARAGGRAGETPEGRRGEP